MRYVTQYGELYRLSERSYLRMLRDGRDGVLRTWADYGAKKLANECENVTDWERREFESALKLESKSQ
jgi:hypothetical protein